MHEVQVFIVPPAAATSSQLAGFVRAPNGWHLLPLSSHLLQELLGRKIGVPDLGAASEPFSEYCDAVLSALSTRAKDLTGAIAVTQYWGGAGQQAAASISSGVNVVPPLVSTDAINRALASIGCPLVAGLDAFDSVGLGRWRNMDSLIRG
jgi:hypothetical protein